MAVILKNNTGSVAKVGYIVTLDPRDSGSFVYVSSGATKALGVITEASDYRKPCKIATLGETAKVFVAGNVVKGNILRTVKANDRASLGSCVIAKDGDAPYLKVGEALDSGSGLISVVLDFSYLQSSSTSSLLGEEFETVSKNLKSYPYTLTYAGGDLDTITYNLGGGLSIVKTFNYTLTVLTSIVLSGDTPLGISLTKTLVYTGDDLTSVSYS